jgi:hypothetical protein
VFLLPIQSTVFLGYKQIRGTAYSNDTPVCNQLRVSATAHRSNPQTVDILCNAEENSIRFRIRTARKSLELTCSRGADFL